MTATTAASEETAAFPWAGGWVVDFGLQDYASVWALQQRLVAARIAGEIPDVILHGEHPAVITLGRGAQGAKRPSLLPAGVPVVEIERGGEATFHGPGQWVAYPIVALPAEHRDLHRWLRALEQWVIDGLAPLGVTAGRVSGKTGVWLDGRKIVSIGVAVRQWVTYHGLALNVSVDLAGFQGFTPCGMAPEVMTSLAQALGPSHPAASLGAVRQAMLGALGSGWVAAPLEMMVDPGAKMCGSPGGVGTLTHRFASHRVCESMYKNLTGLFQC